MVLHPLNSAPPQPKCVSAWEAVARSQKQPAEQWSLIAQPDHADLAGELAERVHCEYFPALDDEVVEAIRLHDEGWAEFDREPVIQDGRPLSFLDIEPDVFVKAWRGSIASAKAASLIGGLLVSFHFQRLAEFRLRLPTDSPEHRRLVEDFLRDEAAETSRLIPLQPRSPEQVQELVDVLQFCDLLSLYVCCGSREEIEFPQRFRGHAIRCWYEDGLCRTEPAVFSNGASLGVKARTYPAGGSDVVPVLLG